MPLSIWTGMEDCLRTIVDRRPASVLDAGIGFGLWGGLLRQYLDVWNGRIQPSEWTTRIDGIEIDEKRIQPHARHLYTEVLVGDIRDLVPRRAAEHPYDVILFGDVIEHLPKDGGLALLGAAARLCPCVVVRIPLGDGWRREGREEPDHHRSQWYASDFSRFPGAAVRAYDFLGNPYGLVVIEPGRKRRVDDRVLAEVDERLERVERRLEGLVRR